ncbi:MAG: terminase family protein [Candidatus Caldarchaeum sp.]
MSVEIVEKVLQNLDAVVERLGITDDGGRPITRLASYQKTIVKTLLERKNRRMCIVASTQCGKSTAVLIGALLLALTSAGEEIWLVSPNYSQAVSKFQYIKRAVDAGALAQFVDRTKPFRRDSVCFINGSIVRCLSAESRKGLLGYSATVLIVDEAQEIADNVFRAKILRMIVGSGMKTPPIVVLIGTANRINFLRDAYVGDDWWKMRITWREGVAEGIMREEEVEFAAKMMSVSEFKAWYEAEFETPAGKAFNLSKMRELMVLSRPIKILHNPESWRLFAGLDVARFGEDESCLVVIRLMKGVEWGEMPAEMMFYETRAKKSLTDVIGWVARHVAEYGIEKVAVDATAIGAGVYDVLRERFGSRVMGVRFAGNERENVYGALVEAIDNGHIRLIKDDEILRQAERFNVEYTVDGRPRVVKTKGARDDIIDALALAVYAASRPVYGRAAPLVGFDKVFG